MTSFEETSFREKQKANQEHITPIELRRFVADNLPSTPISVLDGAIGSGQMLQFINAIKITGIDINGDSLKSCQSNFKGAELIHDSFFNAMGRFAEGQFDLSISNYPFSLKIKDLPKDSQENILSDKILSTFFEKGKLTGVCDFLFIIKMLQLAKRYSVFIAFPGIAYRQAEKKYREYLTSFVKEVGIIENCNFSTTSISVMFLVLDKQHTGATKTFRLDLRTKEYIENTTELNPENWDIVQFNRDKPEMTEEDFIKCEIEARKGVIRNLARQLDMSKIYSELGIKDFPPFSDFVADLNEVISSM